MKSWYNIVVLTGMMAILSSCSTTKYVPDNRLLLNNIRVKTDSAYHDISTALMKSYVRQTPNRRWFSMFKLPLSIYSLSGRDSSKWVNRTLKSLGEPPVIYDSVKAARSCGDLQQQLRNEGYLNAQVELHKKIKGKKIELDYLMKPGEPYFIHSLQYVIADTAIAQILNDDSGSRLLAEGMKFDVQKLDSERKRLTNLLTDNGYYRFHKEYITYQADTVPGSRLIDLTLNLDLFHRDNQPDTLHTRYWMRHINYASAAAEDPDIHLRRHVLHECTHLYSGRPYSSAGLQNTYNHFGRLQAIKYTDIDLRQVNGSDSLDCYIKLLANKPSTISFEPEGTNTAGDLGAAAALTYKNRNLFKGSETFSIKLRGAYEAIKGLEGYTNQDYLEYGAEAKLQFPRFIMPYVYHRMRQKAYTATELSLLYDIQNRPEFHRRLLSATWRYKWNFPGRHGRYQLDLLDLNYVFMPWISDTFRNEYLDNNDTRNAILRYNYEDLFITKIGFGYAYSHRQLALKANIETSGNLLQLGSKIFNSKKNGQGYYQLFNIAFAQYVKGDFDISKTVQIDPANQVVFHLGIGIAYPYGNSNVLPFEKRYFSGGANSVRGWSVRSLGPGKYKEHDGRINFINQTGDMKLDLNAEYRTRLFWKFNGAVFVDAGNIWTLREYDIQPGGQFHLKDFISQMAVGYGLGLRLNFDYFILRFDLGMKAVNPAYETDDDEHYPILHPRFSRDNAFHFAVGLPF